MKKEISIYRSPCLLVDREIFLKEGTEKRVILPPS
jgi:hypothetical protein